MRPHFQARQVACIFGGTERCVARVQTERHSKCSFQARLIARDVREQQSIGFNQNRFGFWIWCRSKCCTAKQTVRKRLRHKLRLRRTLFGKELCVLGDQLNLTAHLLKHHQLGTTHLTAIQTTLTNRARHVVGHEEWFVQLRRQDFQPNLVVLLMQGKEAWRGLGIFQNVLHGPECTRGSRW